MPRDCLSGPEEAIDVWPRGACSCQVSVLRVLRFLRVWRVWRVLRVEGLANGRLGRP